MMTDALPFLVFLAAIAAAIIVTAWSVGWLLAFSWDAIAWLVRRLRRKAK